MHLESAGSNAARDKAFGHRISRRLSFYRYTDYYPIFDKDGIGSTLAAELLCLFF